MWQIERAMHENPTPNKRRSRGSRCASSGARGIIAVQNAEQLVARDVEKASTSTCEMGATCSKNEKHSASSPCDGNVTRSISDDKVFTAPPLNVSQLSILSSALFEHIKLSHKIKID